MASAIGGQCSLVSKNKFGNNISFLESYNNIVVIPFPHLNLIECVGMGLKKDYLVWREQNGFFSALDRRSNLLTWSLVTGKMLYSENQAKDASSRNMEKYEVYRADVDDLTYTQNFYNLADSSINLLKSKLVVTPELLEN